LRCHPRHDPLSPRFQTTPVQVGPGPDRVVPDSQTAPIQVDQGLVRWGLQTPIDRGLGIQSAGLSTLACSSRRRSPTETL
jgi:hypothetical protein